jgi:hypothetical protein
LSLQENIPAIAIERVDMRRLPKLLSALGATLVVLSVPVVAQRTDEGLLIA